MLPHGFWWLVCLAQDRNLIARQEVGNVVLLVLGQSGGRLMLKHIQAESEGKGFSLPDNWGRLLTACSVSLLVGRRGNA